eukprot:gene18353-biopygen5412
MDRETRAARRGRGEDGMAQKRGEGGGARVLERACVWSCVREMRCTRCYLRTRMRLSILRVYAPTLQTRFRLQGHWGEHCRKKWRLWSAAKKRAPEGRCAGVCVAPVWVRMEYIGVPYLALARVDARNLHRPHYLRVTASRRLRWTPPRRREREPRRAPLTGSAGYITDNKTCFGPGGVPAECGGVRRSAGGVRRSTGGVRRSAGGARRSAGRVRRSAGEVQRSAGGVRRGAGGVRRGAGGNSGVWETPKS